MKHYQIVKVVLNSDHKDDQKILDFLPYAGLPMSKLFKKAMLQYIDYQNGEIRSDPFLQAIRQIVREELKKVQFQSTSAPTVSFAPASVDEDEVDPLAFLDELDKLANS